MPLHKPDPLQGVEHVIHDVSTEDLPAPRHSETRSVLHGYAVQHSGSHKSGWLFFDAPEPAYVYGRAARMARGCTNWEIRHAAREMMFDHKLGRDVSTLYLGDKASIRQPREGDSLATVWRNALTPHDSNWAALDPPRS